MSNIQNSSKRIAKNTLVVYAELFITIAINLALSRLVLQALGASDFGLYNVVGGVIAMFTFISSSLAVTTTRFLNFEMGKPDGDVNWIFNQSIVLHITFALLIFVLLETIGIYYILNYLNVDAGKESDAMFVFQVSTVVACIGIVSVPFQSIFVAHEQFKTVAIANISNAIIKLLIVIALLYYGGNALRFYAVGMSVTTFMLFIFFYLYSKKSWPKTVKWKFVRNWKSYKDQLFYSNWNLLATASYVGRNQGSALLINFFFGTVVNAAYAIAIMILQQINNFVGKFDSAVGPQITQNMGGGNFERSLYLASHTCRICILLMEIITFPLYIELDYILHLWLGNVPEGTLILCKYTLLIAVVSATSGGLVQLINATGKIKWFKIQAFFWNTSPLLVGFFMFKANFPPYTIVFLFVVSDILCRVTQLTLLKRIYSFNIVSYIKEAYLAPALLFVIMSIFVIVQKMAFQENQIHPFLSILITLILTTVLSYAIGLHASERSRIHDYIMRKVPVRQR